MIVVSKRQDRRRHRRLRRQSEQLAVISVVSEILDVERRIFEGALADDTLDDAERTAPCMRVS